MVSSLVPFFLVLSIIVTDLCCAAEPTGSVVRRKQRDWYEAYLTCRHRHQTLLLPRSPALSDLHHWLPDDGARLWLGGRYVHTPWRWTDGCGVVATEGCVEVGRLPHPRVLVASDDPFDCLLKCDSPFVALQGKECQCVGAEPGHRVKDTWCDLGCADNLDQSCGGYPHYASLYSAQPSSVVWEREPGEVKGDCAYLHLPTQSTVTRPDLRLRSDACDGRITRGYKRHLCQHCSERSDLCHVTRHRAYVTWLDASEACHKEGGQLLNVRTNRSLPLLFHPYISEDYWIGLKREFVLKWINGSTIVRDALATSIVKEGGFCLTARKSNNSNIMITAVDCSLKLPFVCVPDTTKRPVRRSEMDHSELCRSSVFTPDGVTSSLASTQRLSYGLQRTVTAMGSESSTAAWTTRESSAPPSETKGETTMDVISTPHYSAALSSFTHRKANGMSSTTESEISDLRTSGTLPLLATSGSRSPSKTSRTPSSFVRSKTSPSLTTSTRSSRLTSPGAETNLQSITIHPKTTEGSKFSSVFKKKYKLQSPASGGSSKMPMILSTPGPFSTVTFKPSVLPSQSSTRATDTSGPETTVTVSVDSSLFQESHLAFVDKSTSPGQRTTKTSPSVMERHSPSSTADRTVVTVPPKTDIVISSTARLRTSRVPPSYYTSSSMSPADRIFSQMHTGAQNGSSTTETSKGPLPTISGNVATVHTLSTNPNSSVNKRDNQTSRSPVVPQYSSSTSGTRKSTSPFRDETSSFGPASKSDSPVSSSRRVVPTSPGMQSTISPSQELLTGTTKVVKACSAASTQHAVHEPVTSGIPSRSKKPASDIPAQAFTSSQTTFVYLSSPSRTTDSEVKLRLSSRISLPLLSASTTAKSSSKLTTSGSPLSTSMLHVTFSGRSTRTPQTRTMEPSLTSSTPTTTARRRHYSPQTLLTDSVSPSAAQRLSSVTDSHFPLSTSNPHEKSTPVNSFSRLLSTFSRPISSTSTANSDTQKPDTSPDTQKPDTSPESTSGNSVGQSSVSPQPSVGPGSEAASRSATEMSGHHESSNTRSSYVFTTAKTPSIGSSSGAHYSKKSSPAESRFTTATARVIPTSSGTEAVRDQYGRTTESNQRHSSMLPLSSPTDVFPTRSSGKHRKPSITTNRVSMTTVASTRPEATSSTNDNEPLSGVPFAISKTSVSPSAHSAGLRVGTDPSDRHSQDYRTHVTDRPTLHPVHTDGFTPYNLMPLYIVMGLLSGMVIVVAAVVCGVIRTRISGTSGRWTRMNNYEDSWMGRDNFSTWSEATMRSRYSIEADPQFRFVERSEC